MNEQYRLRALPGWPSEVLLGDRLVPVRHQQLTPQYRLITLHTPKLARAGRPGQFLMVTPWDANGRQLTVLPRPMAISAADASSGLVDFIYRIVGEGTRLMAEEAHSISVTGPLGRGYDLPRAGRILMLGRGVGMPSLAFAADRLVDDGVDVRLISSSRDPQSSLAVAEVVGDALSSTVRVFDSDGTSDPRRLERCLIEQFDTEPPQTILVCGSRRLTCLAVRLGQRWNVTVQVSVEQKMACGMGYCHGCVLDARAGCDGDLVCLQGPVFTATAATELFAQVPSSRPEARL
ncbi:dihydroorotate oxidase electron transfer subunit [Pseudoclavibacter sp. CFCC 11306]|uniref:iron-sulfur cluster-binding protein n=1 Tax=Pseudoclavibacter sp. CFCC 11306 TaxID=1564493 RepID=UPI0013018C10|nr:dihydroorotate oxidase electron transfer subunit [Pseudoclavibacter sp. CFCC 11306]KAB1657673.1 dihydroorotate oxidase electron transfer subunit [Pseudoclavibacter sp. CFCC 11306]